MSLERDDLSFIHFNIDREIEKEEEKKEDRNNKGKREIIKRDEEREKGRGDSAILALNHTILIYYNHHLFINSPQNQIQN